MATANEALLDALVRHQIALLRFSRGLQQRIIKMLDETEDDLQEVIARRLSKAPPGEISLNTRRLQVLQRIITRIRDRAWERATEAWLDDLEQLSLEEPRLIDTAVKVTAPVELQTIFPTPATLRSIVRSRPFEGRVMRDWAKKLRQEDLDRIMAQVRNGVIQGEGSAQIARRVVGTARLRGVDGVTEITRRGAEAITRTAVNFISNQARREYLRENAALIDEEVYVATLDARTTPVCRGLDGKTFSVGEGPIPPLHFNCRSTRVAVLDGEALGDRPAKPVTEKMLLREFADKRGIKVVSSRSDLPRGQKGAFDQFARGRIRDLTGQVPAKTSYQEWLKRQSAEFQDDVLGKTRGRLFRDGGLTLEKFVNRAGDEIPLSELARLQRRAFIAAGLDPDDFRS